MKKLLLALSLVSSSAFAGGNIADFSCHTANGSYNMRIDTTYGTVSVVKASELSLTSFDLGFRGGNVVFTNSSTSQAYMHNDGSLSAVFFADFRGEAKRIRIDSQTRTITTMDIMTGATEVETQIVCDDIDLDV